MPQSANSFEVAIIVALSVLGTSATVITAVQDEKRNVFGELLELCSKAGMGNTGFNRDGTCLHVEVDEGYHNICMNIPGVTGGDFCTVTGQHDWCTEAMPCVENNLNNCPVGNWCVEEWAFENYVNSTGGCGEIGHVLCESTNMMAVLNYEKLSKVGNEKALAALKCLKEKCWLP